MTDDATSPTPTPTGWFGAARRGFANRCPCCGTPGLRDGFLRVRAQCAGCGLRLGEFRADDAPPYFTIFVVGHLVIPGVLMAERIWTPALWLQTAFWVPATLALTLALLPRIKGAVIGWQFAAGIRG